MLDAEPCERLGHQLVAAAVERRVDETEVVRDLFDGLVVVDHAHDVRHEAAVAVLAEQLDPALGQSLLVVHRLNTGENVDPRQLVGNGRGVLRRQLRAVRPVDLVAVVLLGVVAGGDVDARLAVVFPDGKAQLGSGTQGLENADVDAVSGTDLRGGPRKLGGVVAAVHADGHAPILALLALGADDVGKALGGPANDVDIHIM